MRRQQVIAGAFLAFVLSWPGSGGRASAADQAELREVTVESRDNALTVTLKTSGSPKYQAALIDTPARLVIDLESTSYAWRRTPLVVNTGPLKEIRGSQWKKGVTRVVLELSRKTAYAIEEGPQGVQVTLDPKPAIAGTSRISASPPASLPVVPTRVAQAAAPQPADTGQRLISLDFKDADIANLLRILAAESGKNIVAGDDVKGKVSISLRNVPWEQALDTILDARGLQKIEKANVIRIVSVEQLTKEREAKAKVEEAKLKAEAEIRTKIAEAQLKEQEVEQRKLAAEAAKTEAEARGPLKEETIRLSYADPEEVAKTLQGILGIPPEGAQAGGAPITTGPPPIAEPPFSALFGPGAQQPPKPAAISPSQDVLARGITIKAHKPTNSIFIRHYAADLDRIKKLIRENLDVPLPQVKIEARMEILDRTALEQIGVQWGGAGAATESENRLTLVGRGFSSATGGIGAPANVPRRFNPNLTLTELLPVSAATGLPLGGNLVNLPVSALPTTGTSPAGGFQFGIIGAKMNINLVLQALETSGKTRTLARPEIVTVENNEAVMSLGEEIPYATVSSAGTQIQFKEALLKLTVKPTVIREGEITKIKMKVIVENNSRGTTTVDLGSAGAPPVINKRKAETEVLVREGERLVIGGATTGETVSTLRFVPLLGRIPLIGWLFKSREMSETGRELVVFVTPSILKSEQAKPAQAQPAPAK